MIDCCNEKDGIMLIGCSIDVTNKGVGNVGKRQKWEMCTFLLQKHIFFQKNLRMCNFCCTFAADLRKMVPCPSG